MLRGSIPCSWDQNFVNDLDFTYSERTLVGSGPKEIDLIDPNDIHRYSIGIWVVRDVNFKDFKFVSEHFKWLKNIHLQINLFKPGQVGPLHRDHLDYYKKIHKIKDINNILRIILFLQDWKSGHYFEVDGTGITNWKAGDWIGFNPLHPHALANIGQNNRYTLQITGTYNCS